MVFLSQCGSPALPLERFAQLSVVVSASMAAIERIFAILDLKPEINDHPLSQPFAVRRGSVQMDNVSFGYNARNGGKRREVLAGINHNVPGGTRVELVGK